jgi:hypothetical protein
LGADETGRADTGEQHHLAADPPGQPRPERTEDDPDRLSDRDKHAERGGRQRQRATQHGEQRGDQLGLVAVHDHRAGQQCEAAPAVPYGLLRGGDRGSSVTVAGWGIVAS